METRYKFSDCTAAMMQDMFGLTQIWDDAELRRWLALAETMDIDAADRLFLEKLQETFFKMGDTWNEIELIEYFVSPIFALVNFNTPYFKMFSERRISAIIGEYELYGDPDAFIAKGTYYPKTPFFCFNEYKRLEDMRGDTLGQLLAEMLVAQALNANSVPVYGMYVIDKEWYFTVLNGKNYCISLPYCAVKNDLFDIFRILKALKAILIEIAR